MGQCCGMERRITMLEVAGNQGTEDNEFKTKDGKDDPRSKYSV